MFLEFKYFLVWNTYGSDCCGKNIMHVITYENLDFQLIKTYGIHIKKIKLGNLNYFLEIHE